MIKRVVSIGNPAYVSTHLNQLIVKHEGEEVGRVPIEDIGLFMIEDAQVTISMRTLALCAENEVAVVVCDSYHMPAGLMLPFSGHNVQTAILHQQIAASDPAKKKTWQRIVQAKIASQARVLDQVGKLDSRTLLKLIPMVRSGDPDNVEARAATRYFDSLFGDEFTRDREAPGLNAMLNYGYTVLRACVARAVVGAGLHPALGVFHKNQYNPFCLVDDAMEPLRPLVDKWVFEYQRENPTPENLTPSLKRYLLKVTERTVFFDKKPYPLFVALERYAASLRRALCEKEPLICPTL
jgi:CRISPR-associated protein Cas1